MIDLKVKILNKNLYKEASDLPAYKTSGSAGMDLLASLEGGNKVTLAPKQRALIKTGLAIALPEGYEAQVRPRSGLALKEGVTVLNTPGTIDSDYRGEIGVILYNTSDSFFVIENGDRIAQMVIAEYVQVKWDVKEELEETDRGAGGFGSTGKK